MVIPMTTQERGRNRDTAAATRAAAMVHARRRALKAARELVQTEPGAWSLGGFSELVMLGHRAVEIIESETD